MNVGRPGSFHESKVFKRSSLSEIIEKDPNSIFPVNTHIIAGTAFPLNDYVLTPYSTVGNTTTLSRHQKLFNGKLALGHRPIEQAFQILRARWQRLKCLEMQQVSNMNIAIKTCCILHNICMSNSAYHLGDFEAEKEPSAVEVDYCGACPYSALRKRDMIALYLDGQTGCNG